VYGVSPYDIHGFWLYLGRLWEYLSLAMLSPQPVIAAALAAASVLGLVPSWHRSRPLAAALGFLIVFRPTDDQTSPVTPRAGPR
jgi:hypothetical protein